MSTGQIVGGRTRVREAPSPPADHLDGQVRIPRSEPTIPVPAPTTQLPDTEGVFR